MVPWAFVVVIASIEFCVSSRPQGMAMQTQMQMHLEMQAVAGAGAGTGTGTGAGVGPGAGAEAEALAPRSFRFGPARGHRKTDRRLCGRRIVPPWLLTLGNGADGRGACQVESVVTWGSQPLTRSGGWGYLSI